MLPVNWDASCNKLLFENKLSLKLTLSLLILIGDLNAKVGIDNNGYEDSMGRHALGVRNKDGERFANLFAFKKLVIDDKIFPHKRIHKSAWVSSDHTT